MPEGIMSISFLIHHMYMVLYVLLNLGTFMKKLNAGMLLIFSDIYHMFVTMSRSITQYATAFLEIYLFDTNVVILKYNVNNNCEYVNVDGVFSVDRVYKLTK